jgi:hypothetical protein
VQVMQRGGRHERPHRGGKNFGASYGRGHRRTRRGRH